MSIFTFNDFLMAVDRLWARKRQKRPNLDWRDCRGMTFYEVAKDLRPDLVVQFEGTERDPRSVKYERLDDWLGWFVQEWNRNSMTA